MQKKKKRSYATSGFAMLDILGIDVFNKMREAVKVNAESSSTPKKRARKRKKAQASGTPSGVRPKAK